MADLPIELGATLDERLARCLDIKGMIPRALDALGPIAGRDVLLIGQDNGLRAAQLRALGARLAVAPEMELPDGTDDRAFDDGAPAQRDHFQDQADDSVDVVVGLWTSFRGAPAAEIAAAERVARPGGRLLVVHDYGRDDVSRLRGDRPEYGAWSHRKGPFLASGFRVRVIHTFWTFESIDDATDFLAAAFGSRGLEVARTLTRPRLSYKVAIYHRTLGEFTAMETSGGRRVGATA